MSVETLLPLETIGISVILATLLSVLARKIGQNEVIGFVLAGFLLGPFALNYLNPTDPLVVGFAELGLFVLLFYLGIELSLKEFLAAGSAIFGLAMIDMAITTGIGAGILYFLLGKSIMFSLIVGIMLFSTSTAIVAKFIINKNLMQNTAAKTSLAILILQDFLGILLLVFVTSLSSEGGSVVELALTSVVFAVSAFYAVFRFSTRVEAWMKKNDFGHTEMTLYALGVGLVVATIASILGLSTAIGAYFAGFALSKTDSGERIKKNVSFLRDFFLIFFFVGFGTSLFYDYSLEKVVIPSPVEFFSIAVLAVGLGVCALIAHSIAARVFGPLFGINGDDSSMMAILLLPLGEFVVIIATVTGGVLVGAERTLIGPLAFLLIISTLIIFQPLYNMKHLHRKLFGLIPCLEPKAKKEAIGHQEINHARKSAIELLINVFIIACLGWMTLILYNKLPRVGIPVTNSREATAVLVFLFFSSIPLLKSAGAIRRLYRELKHKRQVGNAGEKEKENPAAESNKVNKKELNNKEHQD